MLRDREVDVKTEPGVKEGIASALRCLPSGVFLLTARYEDRRAGLLVTWVQQCCEQPPMLCVCVPKGRAIMPLISESAEFALCHLSEDDRVIRRKFRKEVDPAEDAFLAFNLLRQTETGAPVISSVAAFFECIVSCHMDVDGDHDLFVGKVVNGGCLNGRPAVIPPECELPR